MSEPTLHQFEANPASTGRDAAVSFGRASAPTAGVAQAASAAFGLAGHTQGCNLLAGDTGAAAASLCDQQAPAAPSCINGQAIAPKGFTFRQLAVALSVSEAAIRQRFTQSKPDGQTFIRGQRAKTWTLGALPQSLSARLAALAQSAGFGADIPAFIEYRSTAPAPWQSPVLWADLPAAVRERACRLRNALAPALTRQHVLPAGEFLELARAGYRQQFGHDLAADRLRYLLDRATQRDAGHQNWQRPELFLDDVDLKPAPGIASPAAPAFECRHLDAAIAGPDGKSLLQNSNQPTPADRAHLLHACFLDYQAAADQGLPGGELRTLKAAILTRLYQAVPALYRPQAGSAGATAARPLAALRAWWNAQYSSWIKGGCAVQTLQDDRKGKVGRKSYACPDCDKKIHDAALGYRGNRGMKANVELAFNELRARRLLCQRCLAHYAARRMPATLRARVTPNAIEVAARKGRRALQTVGPTHHCDWSDTQPGHRFVMDDLTPNEPAWDELAGEVISGQTQLLHCEDEASGIPLPFFLYFGAPNARTITKELIEVFTQIGLPHDALLLENGVFKARLVVGENNAREWNNFRDAEEALRQLFAFEAIPDEWMDEVRKRELGFRDPAFGLHIQHARTPMAKTIERSFYEAQKRASLLPGFSGFNQRSERSQALQDFDRRVKAGKEHPGNEYLHLSELRSNYEQIFNDIANRPVNGTRHRGRTPAQYWAEAMAERPLRALPAEILPLLAYRRTPGVKVHPDGIRIALDRFETGFYFNDHTGPLVEKRVEVFRHPDIPDYIHIRHPVNHQLLKVDRVLTRRRTASPDEIAKASAARKAHVTGALGVFGKPENPLASTIIRDAAYSPRDKETGQILQGAEEAHRSEQAAAARKLTQARKAAAVLGGAVPEQPRNPERVLESVAWEEEIRARRARKQQAKANESQAL